MGALSHVRVLDLSRVLAGPWASQFLADLGADVIKIEHPRGGDETRGWGPPFASNEDGSDSDVSAYFLCTNRNKKSVTIDISQARRSEPRSPARAAIRRRDRELQSRRPREVRARLRQASERRTRASSTARSRVSARPAPTRREQATTS